jgi:hypothetical protein
MAQFALENMPAGTKGAEKRQANLGHNVDQGGERKANLKEGSGNVYGNKGSALHSLERSGNSIENTGSYESKRECP